VAAVVNITLLVALVVLVAAVLVELTTVLLVMELPTQVVEAVLLV
jgi:hypothetical protein